jgi:dienelactone hydrolase
MTAPSVTPARFGERKIVFRSGVVGRPLSIESAGPANYHAAMSAPASTPRVAIDAQLFLPQDARGPSPAVVVTPGSLGVAPSHLAHAATLNGLGAAVLVIDPFGARGVASTVANQAQYSFAASAFDVLAAVAALARMPGVDAARIGAQGHSRGGSAVLTAAMRRFADKVLPPGPRLRAVYAAYPWCGHQFDDPDAGATRIRAVIGERDDWCSPQQVQGAIHAMRLKGGDASFGLFTGAAHSFDRESPLERIADAAVAPNAPTVYLASDGAMIHPNTGLADPALTDRDMMIWAMKAGYGVTGATIGSQGDQPRLFREDMTAFWRSALRL